MKFHSGVFAFAVATLRACNKESNAPAIPETASQPDAAMNRPTSPPPAQPIEIATTDVSAALNDLPRTVRRYSAERRKVPVDLNELVSPGYIKSIPIAPTGKKLVLN